MVSKIFEDIVAVKQLFEASASGPSDQDYDSLLAVVKALEDVASEMETVAGVSQVGVGIR